MGKADKTNSVGLFLAPVNIDFLRERCYNYKIGVFFICSLKRGGGRVEI